jgi:hypothetical protein
MKLVNFFLVKKLTTQKGLFKLCFLWSRYRAGTRIGSSNLSKIGTGTVTCQKSESGTVKNSYGSTTLTNTPFF